MTTDETQFDQQLDDEIADEMTLEFFGDDSAAPVAVGDGLHDDTAAIQAGAPLRQGLPIWPDDTAAHVRETVDELRRTDAGGGHGDE